MSCSRESAANVSYSGNSVVPGLPNRYRTPAAASISTNASIPRMIGWAIRSPVWKAVRPVLEPACKASSVRCGSRLKTVAVRQQRRCADEKLSGEREEVTADARERLAQNDSSAESMKSHGVRPFTPLRRGHVLRHWAIDHRPLRHASGWHDAAGPRRQAAHRRRDSRDRSSRQCIGRRVRNGADCCASRRYKARRIHSRGSSCRRPDNRRPRSAAASCPAI